MKIEDLGEFGLIERISKKYRCGRNVLAGIGDDTAVLRVPNKSEVLLLTVDNVVEGVHFKAKTDMRLIGRKALARSLSDIAAMGGIPQYAIVTLGIPQRTSVGVVDQIYEGFFRLAKEFKVELVGGDITRSKNLFLSVAIVGKAKARQWIPRSGARAGDLIFVTGSLGGSIIKHHLTFQPRIKEGQWLARLGIPNAMIDISDGLMGDLKHILEESRVGARLRLDRIPISKKSFNLARIGGKNALQRALWDGEDYELLFTSDVKNGSWVKKFSRRFNILITCIGQIIKEPLKIYVEDEEGKTKEIKGKGFSHF